MRDYGEASGGGYLTPSRIYAALDKDFAAAEALRERTDALAEQPAHTRIAGRYLVTRAGSLYRRRDVLECDGIIGWNVRQSFFQRRAGLATLTATTAAGRQRYAVSDVPLSLAMSLASRALPGLVDDFLLPDNPVREPFDSD